MPKRDEQEFARQQGENIDRTRLDNDQTFFVDNYGGLNRTAPSNNLPYADSPNMLNMKVSLAGMISKRNGSFIRSSTTGVPSGVFISTYTLDTDEDLLVLKNGTSLSVYYMSDEDSVIQSTLIKEFEDVWASGASNDRPSWVWTSEEKPRLIMVSENSVPTELEINQIGMTGDGDTTIQIIGDYSGELLAATTFGLYNDTVLTVTDITHATGSTTFTFSASIPSGQLITVVGLSWHWWAESIKRTADQVYGSTFRFNTSVSADANVELPVEIRRGLEADSSTLRDTLAYGRKLCEVYKQNKASATKFTFDISPNGSDEYAFSNQFVTAGDDTVVGGGAGTESITPGTSYITFGGIDGSGTYPPQPVHIVRQIWLPFNGGNTIPADEIQVYDSTGFQITANYTTTILANDASDKYYWVLDDTLAVETTSTDSVQLIQFSGGHPFGISEQFVEIINSEPNTSYVGSNAVSTYYSPKVVGSYRPWYGASIYANYSSGVFPSVIGLFQDRLVLSGFISAPLVVLFSNSKDNGSRFYYQNFQVDFEDTTVATSPVEVVLDGLNDDIITNVTSWFSSCFVLTRKSTRRIHGGDNVALTPLTNYQNTISSVGCYSRHAVARTDRNIVFVSNSGLYSIDVLEQTGDYFTANVALKVEDYFFENAKNPKLSWIFYNQLKDEIWVGLASEDDEYIPSKCLVLFNKRGAWSEYSLTNGFLPCVAGCTDSFRSFLAVVARDTEYNEEPSTSSQILITEFDLEAVFTDLTYPENNTNITAGSTTKSFHTHLRFPINTKQRVYQLNPRHCPSGYSNNGFRLPPINDQSDNLLIRYYDGSEYTEKELGTYNILSYSNALRYLDSIYHNGDFLEFTLLNDNGTLPIHVLQDNYELSTDDYTISEDGDFIKVTYSGGNASSQYLIGQTIYCYHTTPTFLRQAAPMFKRVVHYVGYYSNKEYLSLYSVDDVNAEASQVESELTDRYKVPVGLKLGILYNDTRTGGYESEVYGSDELLWDVASFDTISDTFRNQENEIVRITIPLFGVGYSFQVINYNMSLDRFQLIGFHVLTIPKGRRSTLRY